MVDLWRNSEIYHVKGCRFIGNGPYWTWAREKTLKQVIKETYLAPGCVQPCGDCIMSPKAKRKQVKP